MCTGCFEKQRFFKLKSREQDYHPYHVGNCQCGGIVCEVDDLCIDAIILLNKKGWTTKFCCSGHLDAEDIGTYVYFKYAPDTLPPVGFRWDRSNNMPTIRYRMAYGNLTGLRGYKRLLDLNYNLYVWANSLSERKVE